MDTYFKKTMDAEVQVTLDDIVETMSKGTEIAAVTHVDIGTTTVAEIEDTGALEATPIGEGEIALKAAPTGEATGALEATPVGEATGALEGTPIGEGVIALEGTPIGEGVIVLVATPIGEGVIALKATPIGEGVIALEATPIGEATGAREATPIGEATGAGEATPIGEATGAETAHPSCIVGKNTGKEKQHSNQWVCHGCKLCAFCFETSENEAMAVCVECGDAYHLTCHNPPVTEEQWRNKWLCSSCDDIDKADTKPTDVKPVDIRLIEVKPVDTKPIDVNPLDIKPIDVKPADIKSDDVKPVDIMAADTKPVDVTPPDSKSVDVKKADIKPEMEFPFIDDAPLPPLSIKSQRLIEEDPFFKKYVPKEKTPDPTNWTVDEVCKYLQEHGCAAQAEAFRHHEIDGRSLLLLTRRDVLYELGLKLGPALKVNHFVQLLQKKDIRKVFPFNEMLY